MGVLEPVVPGGLQNRLPVCEPDGEWVRLPRAPSIFFPELFTDSDRSVKFIKTKDNQVVFNMVNKKLLAVIVFLAIIGVADAGYAFLQHYTPANASACDVNETISCTAINQSEYSVLFGMPVAALGIAGYMLMAALTSSMLLRLIRQEVALTAVLRRRHDRTATP